MESMLASPARMTEITLARLGCYFVLGMSSMAVSVLLAIGPVRTAVPWRRAGARSRLGAVPGLRAWAGPIHLNAGTQPVVASQVAFISTMLPAMMLSGMLYDITSMPHWLQIITYAVPARYLVSILQTLFLAG